MKKYIAMALAAGVALTSCNDFLDREPMDFGNEEAYFKTPDDLKISVNAFYEHLPINKELWGGMYSEEITSDNQIGNGAQSLFYKGDKQTVKMDGDNAAVGSSSHWNFRNLRAINFFINKVKGKMDADLQPVDISGSADMIRHYLGEGYFFRAYDYYRLLRNYGDAPILTAMLPDNLEELTKAGVRAPRNEVARFILANLDTAIMLMQPEPIEAGRVAQSAAYGLKSRVALYEATWEKYHKGTCFVPGNDKWPGAASHPGFTFKAGSADDEINFFLDQAMAAGKVVADKHPLVADYIGQFNRWETPFANTDEVIFVRYYKTGVLSHSATAFLRSGGACGCSRALVNSFLMADGTPIYASADYKGDKWSYDEFQGRDNRLVAGVKPCGSVMTPYTDPVTGKVKNDTTYFYKPNITGSGNEKSTSGYDLNKYVVTNDRVQVQQYQCTSAVPLMRSAEARLNYIEACWLRKGMLDNDAQTYWKELRRRAGVSEDFNKTIAATDLAKENDLAVYSRGVAVDATLYNIRRERRCELFAEGLRLDDLKRWRALDSMVDYQPEGFNLWDSMHTLWGGAIKSSNAVSPATASTYLRPLQITPGSIAYNGYTFPKEHYLEPIPLSEFRFAGSQYYQNPGWPSDADGVALYGTCD